MNLNRLRPVLKDKPSNPLAYDQTEIGLQVGLYFNVQGKTLEVVGDGFYPDVYTMPFNDLSLNVIKNFKNNTSLTLKVENILGDKRESLYQSFGAEDRYFRFRDPGTSLSIGYQISL